MPQPPKPPRKLQQLCSRWSDAVAGISDEAGWIEFFQNELPAFLRSRALFIEILKNITMGNSYPDIRQAQLFDEEILLYLNPRRLFSIRMFIYGPGEYTPIHDHSSRGLIGSALGNLGVVKYIREDDGSKGRYACLRKTETLILKPGRTEVVLPLNQGIHQTGNPTEQTIIMLSVYGRPIRRLYINRFDEASSEVQRMYPPRIRKKMLAADALSAFTGQSF
jgi:hypothetical protein